MKEKNKKTLNVLLVEDNEDQIKGYQSKEEFPIEHRKEEGIILKDKFLKEELEQYKTELDITVARTLEEYENVKDKDFDIVLTDMFIPATTNAKINKEKNTSAWIKYLKKASEETERGIVKGELSVRDFDRNWKEKGIEFKNYLNKSPWERMHGSKTLDYFIEGKSINAILNDEKLKTAPHGVDIFLEQYYEKGRPVCMVTSDHAHGGEGSPFMMYMQNKGIDKYGSLPFASLDGLDIRLLNGVDKGLNNKNGIIKSVQNSLMLRRLYKAGYKKDDIADVSCALIVYKSAVSKEDVLLGEKIEELTFDKLALHKAEEKFQWFKRKMKTDPSDYVREEYPAAKKELEDVKSGKRDSFNYLRLGYGKDRILNGTRIIKEVFYNAK